MVYNKSFEYARKKRAPLNSIVIRKLGLIMSNPIIEDSESKILYMLACNVLATTQSVAAKSFLADLPPSQTLRERPVTASLLSIVSRLDELGSTTPETAALVAAVLRSASSQAWRQPYTLEDFGADFATRSAWFPIADRDGPLVMHEGLVEIMLLDSKIKYPMHSHSPEELYVVLAGEVWWEAEDDLEAPAWRHAGDILHHPSHRFHALTAGEKPVLLLTLWRGGGFEKPVIA
jgi:quercetin dioxygenase-like cupin family protein